MTSSRAVSSKIRFTMKNFLFRPLPPINLPVDLKIKIHLQQLEFTRRRSTMGRHDDVFWLPATRINVMKPVSGDRHIMMYQVMQRP